MPALNQYGASDPRARGRGAVEQANPDWRLRPIRERGDEGYYEQRAALERQSDPRARGRGGDLIAIVE